MKPLNNDNPGCNPTSANCVIWPGPDIPCIKLCKGDNVSEVVYKLATELCDVLTQIDVSTYDLSCLNLTECAPKDFHALIQLLINKICALNDCCASDTTGTGRTPNCPDDCIVEICPQFYYTDAFGNTVTTMALKDYVIKIGNTVCSLIQQIATINSILVNHETRITYIEQNCCNEPDAPLPSIVPTCIGTPPNALGLVDFVQTLEAAFCELRTATGTATELYLGISKECVGLDTENQLSGPGTMAAIPGWVPFSQYGTVADAINNMWLTICDMRSAIKFIQQNCCPGTCEDFVVNLAATFSNPQIKLYFTGTLPVGFDNCNPSGSLVTITDGNGNSVSFNVNLFTIINDPTGYTFDITSTPLNPVSNFTITSTICVTNPEDGSQCSTTVSYVIQNQALCPSVALIPSLTSISYNLTISAPATYVVELLNTCSSSTPLQIATFTVAVLTPITGTFTGLVSNTPYVIRVRVQNYSGGVLINETVCPCTATSTLPPPCDPPVISVIDPPEVVVVP
jgi:hypothetical protein